MMINKESLVEAIRLSNISINDLEIPPCPKRLLGVYGYETLGKILVAPPHEIKKVRHVGAKTFDTLVLEIERFAGAEVVNWWLKQED